MNTPQGATSARILSSARLRMPISSSGCVAPRPYSVAKVRLRYALKDTMIMLMPMLAVLMALIAWPDLVLWLPRLISPELLK